MGFGPDADLSCLLEGVVLELQLLLAVEVALDLVVGHLERGRVPLTPWGFQFFLGRQLNALPSPDLV